MPRRSYIVITILATGFAVFMAIPRRGPLPPRGAASSKGTDDLTTLSGNSTKNTESSETYRTKSKIRSTSPRPMVEATTELFKNTIIPAVDFPEQSLQEVITSINRLIEAQGISPRELRIVCHDLDVAKLKIGETRLRNVPIPVALKYIIDRRRISYVIREGVIELADWTTLDPPEPPGPVGSADPADPFAEPGSPATPPQPLDPNDPFAPLK